jgi:hypothetical protein
LVTWLDNFSKSYAANMQAVDKGTYSDCNWTGEGHKVSCALNPSPLNLIPNLPGMSVDMFSKAILKRITKAFTKMEQTDDKVFETSWVTRFDIRRVPPKYQPRSGRVFERDRLGGATLKVYYPERMIDISIGSNWGLMKLIRDEHDRIPLDERTQYRVILSDVNIFARLVKVSATENVHNTTVHLNTHYFHNLYPHLVLFG